MIKTIEDGIVSNEEELTINGLHAYRFKMLGKNKGMFGRSFSYVVTVLEGVNEYVVLNANCRTDDFEQYKGVLKQFAFDVKGIAKETQASSADTAPTAPATVPVVAPTINLPASIGEVPPADKNDARPVRSADVQPKATGAPVRTSVPQVLGSDAIAEKLRAIDKLKREGLITEKDYEIKKQELLGAL